MTDEGSAPTHLEPPLPVQLHWSDGPLEWRTETNSPAGTRHIGRLLGEHLRPGDLLLLEGQLGSGKTTLAQGIGEALGVGAVASPSFLILREHEGGRVPLYHIDLYRAGAAGLADLEWQELLDQGVMLVEWPEMAGGGLPSEHLRIAITGDGDDPRLIAISAAGRRYENILEEMQGDENPRD